MIHSEAVLGLPGFEVTDVEESASMVCIRVRCGLPGSCVRCGSCDLRLRDRRIRFVRHESWGLRRCQLALDAHKWRCRACGRVFWERFPGLLPGKRATERFRRQVSQRHWDGVPRSLMAKREKIGSATVERWFLDYLRLEAKKRHPEAPRVLGIDEHFFTRKQGYATTFCDLGANKVFDVVLGRSEVSLEGYLNRLKGKDKVEVVCMDLSSTYRAIARKHFPNARIVADRFHVIRLVGHHFLNCWKLLDLQGSRSRGLLSLMRRKRGNLKSPEQQAKLDAYLAEHPSLEAIYWFKQELCELLNERNCTAARCRKLARRFLSAIQTLLDSKFPPLVALGETLYSWQEEIACMWRFAKNNGITEGFHNKMETLSRQAYGFRNFENYRLRVRVMCA